MTKYVFIVAGLSVICSALTGCSKSDEDSVRQAEDEVFAIHNQVMPKIGDMMKLRHSLDQRIVQLDKLQQVKIASSGTSSQPINEEKGQAQLLVRSLIEADSVMTHWMTQYNGDTLAELPTDQALRYLEQQKEQINDVKAKVDISINQTNEFLSKQ